MQNKSKMKKTNDINYEKWLFEMLLRIGLVGALLLMYLPVYFENDELFSELNEIAQNQDFVTKTIKSITTDSYDPKILDIMKEVPRRSTEKEKTYVEKGFSRFASSLPGWLLAVIILDAVFLFGFATFLVSHSGKLTYTIKQLEHKKYPYIVYEVLLCSISFIFLLLPALIGFGLKGATTAIAAFYSGLFTWYFHLLRCPYNIQFRVPEEGWIDKEKCKMMSEYYSKLLSFVLGVFSAITIGLVWYVSQLLTEASVHIPKLLRHQLRFLFLHDFYGSVWLLLFISKLLAWNYFDIVRRCKVTKHE